MLIPCPACGRQISVEAEACPQCGHPNRPAAPGPSQPPPGPTCYRPDCDTPATTRCQRCVRLSCAVHVNSIFVPYGQGGAHELRCSACYEAAQSWKVLSWVIAAVMGIGVLIFLGVVFTRFGR